MGHMCHLNMQGTFEPSLTNEIHITPVWYAQAGTSNLQLSGLTLNNLEGRN